MPPSWIPPTAFLLAAFALSSCKKEVAAPPEAEAPAEKREANTAKAATMDDAAAPMDAATALMDAAPASSQDHPLLKLQVQQPGDKRAVAKLLPEYRIASAQASIEEGMRQIIELSIFKEKQLLAMARVERGKIFEVRVFDPSFVLPASKMAPGQTLPSVDSLTGCGCQGEDGTDGFLCHFKAEPYTIVFETEENDCSVFELADTKKAIKGRTIAAVGLLYSPPED